MYNELVNIQTNKQNVSANFVPFIRCGKQSELSELDFTFVQIIGINIINKILINTISNKKFEKKLKYI